jgi:hypothetical protein
MREHSWTISVTDKITNSRQSDREQQTKQLRSTFVSVVLLDATLRDYMTAACIVGPHSHHAALP